MTHKNPSDLKKSKVKEVAIYCSKKFTIKQVNLLQCLLSLCLSKGNLEVTKTSKLQLERIYSSLQNKISPFAHFLAALYICLSLQ